MERVFLCHHEAVQSVQLFLKPPARDNIEAAVFVWFIHSWLTCLHINDFVSLN